MIKKTKRPVPEDVDCRYCVRYNQGKSCELLDCNILAERIESGNIGYEDLIENTFYYHPELTRRLQYLIKTFPGTMWADDLHERRFCYSTAQNEDQYISPAYYAGVYLLTSNDDLYNRSGKCFLKNRLYLRDFRVQGISPENYTLYAYARMIYSGNTKEPMTEMIDGWILPQEVFGLIVNAVLIAQYGADVLNISKTTTRMEENKDVSIPCSKKP